MMVSEIAEVTLCAVVQRYINALALINSFVDLQLLQ